MEVKRDGMIMEVKRDAFINQSTGSFEPCMFLNAGKDMAENKTEILALINLYSKEMNILE